MLASGLGFVAAGCAVAVMRPGRAVAANPSGVKTAKENKVTWLAGVPNGRDIGGIVVAGGKRIRTGIMLRTAALAGATPAGLVALKKAGVLNVVDLRTDAEIKAQPDPKIAGIAEKYLNVFGDSIAMGVADFTNPQGTAATADAMMVKSYRQMITLDTAHAAYKRFLSLALEGKPFVFHCTEGKDRTGWGAALLLSLLTASHDQIVAEYMLSNTGLIEQNALIERQMKAANANVNMDVLKTYLTVSPTYLAAAFEEANTRFGSLQGYVKTALGFSDNDIAALRRIYLR